MKQFSEESTHSVPLEAEPYEITGEDITMETSTVESSTTQEYKAHEQKVSLALEAFGEEIPVDISESVVPGEITMEIRSADSDEPEEIQIEEQTMEIIPETFTEQVFLPTGESLLPTEIVFDISTAGITQRTESKVLEQRTVSVTESTGERILEVPDEAVKPMETPDITPETAMLEMTQMTEVGEQVEVEPEDHVSSEEGFYPAEEEVEPKVLDRETVTASVQPEIETVSGVQITEQIEGTTHEIIESVQEGAYSTEVTVDVRKVEKKEPEEAFTHVQTIMIQPDTVQKPAATKPEEGISIEVTCMVDTKAIMEDRKDYQVSELETQIIPEFTTEVKKAPEDAIVETTEVSQVTTETIAKYPEETQVSDRIQDIQPETSKTVVVQKHETPETTSPIEIIVDLDQADYQVPTQFTTEEQVEEVEKDFTIESTIQVQETAQIVGFPGDVAQTTFEVPLQTGIPEEPIPEDQKLTIHTAEFAMDVDDQPKRFPEMTLVIEQDGQLTVETKKEPKTEELSLVEETPVGTEQVEHPTPTEAMLHEKIMEQLPEQPMDIFPVEDQTGIVTETRFDVIPADKTVPDMMSVIEQKLDDLKAEMITSHEEIMSQQVDEESEVSIASMQVGVTQQPNGVVDHQGPSQFTTEEVEQLEKNFTIESTIQVQETAQIVGFPMDVTETTFEVPLQTGIPEEPIPEDQKPTIHTAEFAIDVIDKTKAQCPEITLVVEQGGQLTIETAKTEEEIKGEELSLVEETPVITELVEYPTPGETVVQEQIMEQIPEQPTDSFLVEDQTGIVTEITFNVDEAEMITPEEELMSQQVDQESEVFFDAEEVGVRQQPDDILVREKSDQIQPEQIKDIEHDTAKPEPTQVAEQITDVQPEFISPRDEGIEFYSPDVTQTITGVESGMRTFPEMMRVLEQKMDSFKTEFVSAQPDTVFEQDSKLTEKVFDIRSAQTVVPEPARMEDQVVDVQLECFEGVPKVTEETSEILEIPTGTAHAQQQTLVAEQISQLQPQTIGPTEEVTRETSKISEIVADVGQADRKFPEITMTFEQMAIQQPGVVGDVEEVTVEAAGIIEAPSEVTVAEFESPTETQTPEQQIDTKVEVPQEVKEMKQEVSTVSETQYIVHTAGMDVPLETQIDEQAEVTDLGTTGMVEGIPEETTQVSEITFDVSQAEQKYPEMTLVLEQKGDIKSEMVAGEITLEQQEILQLKDVAHEVSTAYVEGSIEYQTLEQKIIKQPSEVPLERTAEEEDVAFESELVIDMQLAEITEKRETLTEAQTKEFPFSTTEVAMRPEEVSTQPVEVILDIGKAQVTRQTITQTEPVESPEVKGTAVIQDQIPAQDVSVIFFDAVEDHDLKEADRTEQEAQAPETISRITPEATEETPVPLEAIEISETHMQPQTEPFEATEALFREQLSPETIERITPEVTEETLAVLEMEASESHVVLEGQTLETTEDTVTDEIEVELQVEPADVTDIQVEQEYEEESSSEKVSSQETVIELSLAESDMTESHIEPIGEYEIPEIVEEAVPVVQEFPETIEITEEQVPSQPQAVVEVQFEQQLPETRQETIADDRQTVTEVIAASADYRPEFVVDTQVDKTVPEYLEETSVAVGKKCMDLMTVVPEVMESPMFQQPLSEVDGQIGQPVEEITQETIPADHEELESIEVPMQAVGAEVTELPQMVIDVQFDKQTSELVEETTPVSQETAVTSEIMTDTTGTQIVYQPQTGTDEQFEQPMTEILEETVPFDHETAEPMEITSQMSDTDMSKQPIMEVDITVEHPGTQEIIQETLPQDQVVVETKDTISEVTEAHIGEQLLSLVTTQGDESVPEIIDDTQAVSAETVELAEVESDVEEFFETLEQPTSQTETQLLEQMPDAADETKPVDVSEMKTFEIPKEVFAIGVLDLPESQVEVQKEKPIPEILEEALPVHGEHVETTVTTSEVVVSGVPEQPETQVDSQIKDEFTEILRDVTKVDEGQAVMMEIDSHVVEAEMSQQPLTETSTQIGQFVIEVTKETVPVDDIGLETSEVTKEVQEAEISVQPKMITESQVDQIRPELLEDTFPQDQETTAISDVQVDYSRAQMATFETQVEMQTEQPVPEIIEETLSEDQEKTTVFETQPIATTEVESTQQLETQVQPQIEQETPEILEKTLPETQEEVSLETEIEYKLEAVQKIETHTDVLQKVQLQDEQQGTKI